MNTLRIEKQEANFSSEGLVAKFAKFVSSFFSSTAKKDSDAPQGHSFLDQATRLGCDMSHFNHIS